MRWVLALLTLALAAAAAGAPIAPTRADVQVTGGGIASGYPQQLTFSVQATSTVAVEQVTLRYTIFGGSGAFTRPESFTPATEIDVALVVETDTASAYIPVGSVFTYHWEFLDANGDTFTSAESEYVYLPPGVDWQSVANDFFVVHYHGNREDLANEYLEAATDTYATMGELLQVELEDVPVRLVLFANESELEPASPGTPDTRDADLITCGQQLSPVVMFAIPQTCVTPDRTDTVRHEFTHILVDVAASGPLSVIPSWLNEGTAVTSQTEPGEGYLGAFETAVRTDRLIPFAQMNTPPASAAQSNLFYGQSYEMVQFLLRTRGPTAFAELFGLINGGERFDRAIEAVYGLDLAALEDAFREEHGLAGSQVEPTVAPTQPPSAPDPATAPEQPTAVPGQSQAGGDSEISRTTVALVLVAVLFALLGVLCYLLVVMQSRNREARAAAYARSRAFGRPAPPLQERARYMPQRPVATNPDDDPPDPDELRSDS